MKERFKLNSELVRVWLDEGGRKISFLASSLDVSYGTVERMLLKGDVPKPRTLKKLADLLKVQERELLIPREAA